MLDLYSDRSSFSWNRFVHPSRDEPGRVAWRGNLALASSGEELRGSQYHTRFEHSRHPRAYNDGPQYPNAILLDSVQFLSSRNQQGPVFLGFRDQRKSNAADPAAPALFDACATGADLGTSQMLLYRGSPPGSPLETILFTDTTVAAYQSVPQAGGFNLETDTFNTSSETFIYMQIQGPERVNYGYPIRLLTTAADLSDGSLVLSRPEDDATPLSAGGDCTGLDPFRQSLVLRQRHRYNAHRDDRIFRNDAYVADLRCKWGNGHGGNGHVHLHRPGPAYAGAEHRSAASWRFGRHRELSSPFSLRLPFCFGSSCETVRRFTRFGPTFQSWNGGSWNRDAARSWNGDEVGTGTQLVLAWS